MSDNSELRKLQAIIDNQADRILDLEAALKEAGEMWVRKDNRIEQLEAALRLAHSWIDPDLIPEADYVIINVALAPEQDK